MKFLTLSLLTSSASISLTLSLPSPSLRSNPSLTLSHYLPSHAADPLRSRCRRSPSSAAGHSSILPTLFHCRSLCLLRHRSSSMCHCRQSLSYRRSANYSRYIFFFLILLQIPLFRFNYSFKLSTFLISITPISLILHYPTCFFSQNLCLLCFCHLV